jgi:hypothetical protein
MRPPRAAARAMAAAAAGWIATGLVSCMSAPAPAQAASVAQQLCNHQPSMSVRQQERLLRLAAIAQAELQRAGAPAALVARSGLDLSAIGQRYSHAGISLAASPNGPWSVRQLYYACDERRPRLFDQGLPGFVSGTEDPDRGFLLIVPLPDAQARDLAAAALDEPRALRVLAGTYSANAHAWSLRYQNCNQWVAELMAVAWGALPDGDDLRARAQAWLRESGYQPTTVQVGSHWRMAAAGFVPWLHFDDHPQDDRYGLRFRISMPEAIEAFVRLRAPAAGRVEICQRGARVVVRRAGAPLGPGCEPAGNDESIVLD